jgi:hypothetical protein
MYDLALKVGEIHRIEVHDADRPYPRRGKVERQRRTESARTDGEDPGGLELPLAGNPDLGQEEVSRISQYFGVRKLRLGLGHRRAARDAGHDGQDVPRMHRCGGRCKVANIRLVEVQVDEVAQSAIVLQQMALEPVVRRQ